MVASETGTTMFECTEQIKEHQSDLPMTSETDSEALAKQILASSLRFRRFSANEKACAHEHCSNCMDPHLSKVIEAVEKRLPIIFVLPAFPGKSPNPAKVLGALPDMAERYALAFLQNFCDLIKAHYAPGARIILCSDGRVFSDAVGLREDDVTAYQREIAKIIEESNYESLSTFDLDDVYSSLSYDEMRARLMEQHGRSLEDLKAAISRGGKSHTDTSIEATEEDKEANRLYCGITRFLVEDAHTPGQVKSRTAIQKDCRERAYTVIQRSNAWSGWVEAHFPSAVRLSIHPQNCGSRKFGIRLMEPDQWITPWHGVAVERDGQFVLMKRSKAEELGARLVTLNGQPSHYVLEESKK